MPINQTRGFVYMRQEGRITAYLEGLDIEMRGGSVRLATEVAQVYLDALRRYTPVGAPSGDPRRKEGPGALRAGWFVVIVDSGAKPRVLILNRCAYLKWVLRGHAAIDQRQKPPGRRWPLHFWVGSTELFRWYVRAVPANQFDRRAVLSARRAARRVAAAELGVISRRALVRAR